VNIENRDILAGIDELEANRMDVEDAAMWSAAHSRLARPLISVWEWPGVQRHVMEKEDLL
jgi:hypothetical protein